MWFHWSPSSFPGDHDFTGTLAPNNTREYDDRCNSQSANRPNSGLVLSPELGPGCPRCRQSCQWPWCSPRFKKDQREEPNWKSVNEYLCEAQGLVVQQEPHTVRRNDVPNRKENHAEKNQCSRYPIKGGPPHSPKIKGSHPRLYKARAVRDQVQVVDKVLVEGKWRMNQQHFHQTNGTAPQEWSALRATKAAATYTGIG